AQFGGRHVPALALENLLPAEQQDAQRVVVGHPHPSPPRGKYFKKYEVRRAKYKVLGAATRRANEIRCAGFGVFLVLYFALRTLYFHAAGHAAGTSPWSNSCNLTQARCQRRRALRSSIWKSSAISTNDQPW